MYYPDDLVEEVRSRNDIVDVISGYVRLQKKGASYFGLCPFHNEKSPSFSVSPTKQMYYCFGCGAAGDVVDFAAKLFDLGSLQAAQRLAADFGIFTGPGRAVPAPHKPKRPHIRQFREDEMFCFRVLTDYLHLLEDWKVRYAPKTPDDDLDDRFVEACQMLDRIEYLTDILTVGDLEERVAVVEELMKDSTVAFLQDYTARKREEDVRYERGNDADHAL